MLLYKRYTGTKQGKPHKRMCLFRHCLPPFFGPLSQSAEFQNKCIGGGLGGLKRGSSSPKQCSTCVESKSLEDSLTHVLHRAVRDHYIGWEPIFWAVNLLIEEDLCCSSWTTTLLLAEDVRSAAAPCCARGPLQSPPCGGLTSPLLPVAHCDLYFNHKYAHPAPLLPGTPYFTKPSWDGALCRPIWVRSLIQVGNKNGHNGRPQGSPSCFLRDTIYVIRYLANVPLRRLVVVKRGAKVPRGPLLAGGYARIFIPRDASCRHGTRFSQRACRGPPHALGPTKERNMPDEEGEACPMTKTSWPWPRLSGELQPRCDIPHQSHQIREIRRLFLLNCAFFCALNQSVNTG